MKIYKFKVNKLEMFALSKPVLFKTVFTSFFFLLALLVGFLSSLDSFDPDSIALFVSLIVVGILFLFYPELVENSKRAIVLQTHTELQESEALRRTDYLLRILNPKFKKGIMMLCANRIAYLIGLGYFQQAKEEIVLFRQHFDIKNNPMISAALFYNSAIVNLYEGEFDEYKINIENAYKIKNEAKGLSKLNLVNMIDNNACFVDSFFTDDPNFETVVLNDMKIAERLGKSSVLTRYFAIFNYYKRKGNTEKAIQYANTVIQVANGNFELYDCRLAKEYIENANKSN